MFAGINSQFFKLNLTVNPSLKEKSFLGNISKSKLLTRFLDRSNLNVELLKSFFEFKAIGFCLFYCF